MDRRARMLVMLSALLAPAFSGCLLASRGELDALESRNRVLMEQHRAQLTEINNLKVHSRNVEDQLAMNEQKMAVLDEQMSLERQRAQSARDARDRGEEALDYLAGHSPVPPETRRRLVELSRRCPSLKFDPRSGVGRLESDLLFDSGSVDPKPGANQALTELANLLRSPEGSDFKVLIVGHTDDRGIAKKGAREQFADNLQLSAQRAKSVADHLVRQGVSEKRVGIAGYGPHQPLTTNDSGQQRGRNRRVEVFVMAPEAPVVGWTETVPGLY
jgi:chemotaxis protein MotB